jgi:hypothetical protein
MRCLVSLLYLSQAFEMLPPKEANQFKQDSMNKWIDTTIKALYLRGEGIVPKGNIILKRVEGVPLFLPRALSQTNPEQRLGHHGNAKFPRLFPNHHPIMTLGPGRVVE